MAITRRALTTDRRRVVRAASERRMLAIIGDIAPPKDGNADVRIFLNCDYLSVDTPLSDPHYVGTFSFFGEDSGGHGGGHAANPSFAVDLTETLRRLARQKRITGDERQGAAFASPDRGPAGLKARRA
jgi:tyrosinase